MATDVTGLDEMLHQLDSLNLSKEDKVMVIDAGANAYIKHLKPKIPVNENRKQGKHLREQITYKPGQYADGSTDVGFTEKGYYYRFLNNGTKHIHAIHFMERAGNEAKDDMQRAMKDVILRDLK